MSARSGNPLQARHIEAPATSSVAARASTLAIYLHGFGSSAKQFRAVWSRAGCGLRPGDVFLDGFESDPLTGLRRWFTVSGREDVLARSLRRCADALEQRLGAIVRAACGDERGLELTLAGHSQGGMLALELARRARLRIARVDCFACFLPSHLDEAGDPRLGATGVAIYSSRADRYVPRRRVAQTVAQLRRAGFRFVSDFVASSLPHQFSVAWLQRDSFVREAADDV